MPKYEITFETDDDAAKALELLDDAAEEGEIEFAFNVKEIDE